MKHWIQQRFLDKLYLHPLCPWLHLKCPGGTKDPDATKNCHLIPWKQRDTTFQNRNIPHFVHCQTWCCKVELMHEEREITYWMHGRSMIGQRINSLLAGDCGISHWIFGLPGVSGVFILCCNYTKEASRYFFYSFFEA